jgi:hypothetical protein
MIDTHIPTQAYTHTHTHTHTMALMQVVLERVKTLRHLDLKRVTDEERRQASLQARKVEERMQVKNARGDVGPLCAGMLARFACMLRCMTRFEHVSISYITFCACNIMN